MADLGTYTGTGRGNHRGILPLSIKVDGQLPVVPPPNKQPHSHETIKKDAEVGSSLVGSISSPLDLARQVSGGAKVVRKVAQNTGSLSDTVVTLRDLKPADFSPALKAVDNATLKLQAAQKTVQTIAEGESYSPLLKNTLRKIKPDAFEPLINTAGQVRQGVVATQDALISLSNSRNFIRTANALERVMPYAQKAYEIAKPVAKAGVIIDVTRIGLNATGDFSHALTLDASIQRDAVNRQLIRNTLNDSGTLALVVGGAKTGAAAGMLAPVPVQWITVPAGAIVGGGTGALVSTRYGKWAVNKFVDSSAGAATIHQVGLVEDDFTSGRVRGGKQLTNLAWAEQMEGRYKEYEKALASHDGQKATLARSSYEAYLDKIATPDYNGIAFLSQQDRADLKLMNQKVFDAAAANNNFGGVPSNLNGGAFTSAVATTSLVEWTKAQSKAAAISIKEGVLPHYEPVHNQGLLNASLVREIEDQRKTYQQGLQDPSKAQKAFDGYHKYIDELAKPDSLGNPVLSKDITDRLLRQARDDYAAAEKNGFHGVPHTPASTYVTIPHRAADHQANNPSSQLTAPGQKNPAAANQTLKKPSLSMSH